MARTKPQKVYVTKLVVRGSGEFPIDMLRYDSCTPWDEGDSARIEHRALLRSVTLRRFSRGGMDATTGRWKSYGWEVVEETALTEWTS